MKSPWLLHFDCGSCNGCDIEILAALTPFYDIERFGIVNMGNPKHADVLLVTGPANHRNYRVLRNLYEQMPDPKYVIAMGACTVGGGPYFKYGYHVVKGVDLVVPVDVYVPGCPPRPESLLEGLMRIQDKIRGHKIAKRSGTGVSFGQLGIKVEDELPVPHHAGYVAAPADREPLYSHQKLTS